MMPNILLVTLLLVGSSSAAPSVTRLEAIDVERASVNTIESDLVEQNDRSMRVPIGARDELFPTVTARTSSSPSYLPLSPSLISSTATPALSTPVSEQTMARFASLMERLSAGQGPKIEFAVIVPMASISSDMLNKRIIYTAPQLGDSNPDMRPE